MKRYMNRTLVMVMGVIVVIVLITGLSILSGRSQNPSQQEDAYPTWLVTPTRPPWCVPLPPTQTLPPGPATPTPNILTQQAPVVGTPQPTYTPYPTPFIIDLAPNLPGDEKAVVYVFLCNGDKVLYYIAPLTDPYDVIDLEEGDIITGIGPPAKLMRPPPYYTITPSPSRTPYISPTPYP